MRVLVCGSRHFSNYNLLKETLDEIQITEIIEGEAEGADLLAAKYAEGKGLLLQRFPADWEHYGRSAGPIRNSQMLNEGKPEMVVAFLGPNSRGTQNMIDQATKAGIEVKIVEI